MTVSWRSLPSLALGAALLLPGAAVALDQAELAEMEALLQDLGFNPGAIDGVVDANTIEAIRQYQDFAVLPGAPEPSEKLLEELRGVAAAFTALSASRTGAAAGGRATEPGTARPQPETAPPPETGDSQPQAVAEKVIVPPPPAPPKLKPAEADKPAETGVEAPPPETAAPDAAEAPAAIAEPSEPEPEPAPPPAAPPQQATLPPVPDVPAAPVEPDPEAEARARIEAEIAPYLQELQSGALTRAELAKRFNAEGRQALQLSRFDEAIGKFSVAIYLDPKFAGAYSNRGTAYQKADQPELAAADFAKAKELGFGGLRLRDGSQPFN